MFVFPYADEASREKRFPWMNWLLILANIWLFVDLGTRPDYEVIVHRYGFIPAEIRPVTLLSSLFLHGSFMHLLGNMWFLYLFGDNVENRCGPFKYLLAYLVSGIAGDLSHFLFFPQSDVPSIGASGAIFGVMGMYLFFFPRNRIKIFYFFFILAGTTVVRAIWVIGIFFGMELLYSRLQTLGGMESGIGHLAHSGGFIAGAAMAAFYSSLRLVPVDRGDLWAHLTGAGVDSINEQAEAERAQQRMLREEPEEYRGIRADDPLCQIVALLHAGRTDEARRAWRRYAFDNHEAALPVREQLEIALALDKNGDRSAARDAYERLLTHYPHEQPYAAEANLALAGMLLHELKESGDEREIPVIEKLLRKAAQTHPYAPRRALAEKWLQALQG